MSQQAFEIYASAIPIIRAREALFQLTIADFPHLKKERRSRVHKDLYKEAFPDTFDRAKNPLNTEDVVKILSGMNNGR